MKIAELSRRSGVSGPTIKYYVREGLLRAGELTSPNQARYDDTHLRRLRLIRALVDVGGLSIAATREVLAAIDEPRESIHETLGKAQSATTPRRDYASGEAARTAAREEVDCLISRRGWRIKPTSPARELLAETVAALHELGQDDLITLDEYAEAAEAVARTDVRKVLARGELDSILEGVVVGTVLGDTLFAALRRLAQQDVSARETDPSQAGRML